MIKNHMESKRVTHFVRNDTHLNDPFIHGQIDAHIGFKPSVVFKYPSKSGAYKFTSDLEGVERLEVGGLFNYYYLKKLWRSELRMVRKFLEEQRPDILHLHYGTDAYIYTDVMKDSGIPSVVSFYGYDASSVNREFCGYGARLVRNGAFAHASRILAMSPDMKEDLLRMGCPEEKVTVHYYGVATKFFSNLIRVYRSDVAVVNLLMMATIVPQKGHDTLVQAIAVLRDRGMRNFHLTIVGEGSLREHIAGLITELELNTIITVRPFVKHCSKEMGDVLLQADIFVHPSVTAPDGAKEGIPGTIVEAMASGLPVLTTRHAGIPHVVDHGSSGLLVPEYDVLALADSLEVLITDSEMREKLGMHAKQRAVKHLDIQKNIRNLESIYDEVCGFPLQ